MKAFSFMTMVFAALLVPIHTLAWDTDSCPVPNPGTSACTCVSNGVQSSGNFGPVNCKSSFSASETIGTWQSVNYPPSGTRTWVFKYDHLSRADGSWQSKFDENTTTMSVSAGVKFWNVWDDKFTSHPGGKYRVQVYFDGTAVAFGYKEFSVCGSDFEKRCSSNDVYWYDACGAKRGMAQDCGSGTCSSGACACSSQASAACYNGDVWWYDCNGGRTSMKEDCGAGTCEVADCQPQTPSGPFHEDCIVSDDRFRDISAMTAAEVQAFLDMYNGRLRESDLWQEFTFSYQGSVGYDLVLGNGKKGRESSPADVIYWSARDPSEPANEVNPQVLLVTLQKEQGLIADASKATQNALDWAMGYGVLEGSGPTPKYRGFFTQVLSAAFQFTQDFNRLPAGPQARITVDGKVIQPRNRATAVLYKYTPHVSAARLFAELWEGYFGARGCGTEEPSQDSDEDIELYCSNHGPYSVLGWAFSDENWKIVPGSWAHLGDDTWADDWNTTLGSCDTEIAKGPMWVHAVASGTVLYAGEGNGYGYHVVVRLSKDPSFAVRYAHLQVPEKLWRAGDEIRRGEIIGAVGDTGTECAHLHLVLYCNIGVGSTAESRLSKGQSPSRLSGDATKHSTWFKLDPSIKPSGDTGGGTPDCSEMLGSSGNFLDQVFVEGCTEAGGTDSRWFIGHAGQEVTLDVRPTSLNAIPPKVTLSLLDGFGNQILPEVEEESGIGLQARFILQSDDRYVVRLEAGVEAGLWWRLHHNAVQDGEPDDHVNAPLMAPGADEVHAIDHRADRDVFTLGAIPALREVRIVPTGEIAKADVSWNLMVLRNGQLAEYDGVWYAIDQATRQVSQTDEQLFVVVDGTPGFYRIQVSSTLETPDGEEPGPDGDDAAFVADAGPNGGASCVMNPSSQSRALPAVLFVMMALWGLLLWGWRR